MCEPTPCDESPGAHTQTPGHADMTALHAHAHTDSPRPVRAPSCWPLLTLPGAHGSQLRVHSEPTGDAGAAVHHTVSPQDPCVGAACGPPALAGPSPALETVSVWTQPSTRLPAWDWLQCAASSVGTGDTKTEAKMGSRDAGYPQGTRSPHSQTQSAHHRPDLPGPQRGWLRSRPPGLRLCLGCPRTPQDPLGTATGSRAGRGVAQAQTHTATAVPNTGARGEFTIRPAAPAGPRGAHRSSPGHSAVRSPPRPVPLSQASLRGSYRQGFFLTVDLSATQ